MLLQPGGDRLLLVTLAVAVDLTLQGTELLLTHMETLDPLGELRILRGELLVGDGAVRIALAEELLVVLQLGEAVLAVGPVRGPQDDGDGLLLGVGALE